MLLYFHALLVRDIMVPRDLSLGLSSHLQPMLSPGFKDLSLLILLLYSLPLLNVQCTIQVVNDKTCYIANCRRGLAG